MKKAVIWVVVIIGGMAALGSLIPAKTGQQIHDAKVDYEIHKC